jgi:sulfur carrier protein
MWLVGPESGCAAHVKLCAHFRIFGMRMIHVTINGQNEAFEATLTVLALLQCRGLAGKRLAVERNGEIVPKGRHGDTVLANGDRLEIVVAVGGG